MCGDLTRIAVTNANILTSQRSTVSYDPASMRWERSPTISPSLPAGEILVFGIKLEPRVSTAQNSLASKLLRTF